MEMAHIGSGHMYTYVSPVFICGKVDDAARKAVENCRIYNIPLFTPRLAGISHRLPGYGKAFALF